LKFYRPYKKQSEFHAAGATHRERLFMAGNQLGKTVSGAAEASIHLTGRYPDWWTGRRWDRPIIGWAAGVTGESTRDTVQRLLIGRPGRHGTGFIPKSCIVDSPAARGVPDLLDHVKVRHASGGESIVYMKSYEKGREKWQGDTVDFVWFDEEPSLDIFSEGLTRTQATGGMVWMTFTPLLGMSDVVMRFIMEQNPERSVTQMTIDDAEHYTPEERAKIIASYPPHEREARSKGIPTMGSGRVFPVSEEQIACEPFPVPDWWPVIGGLDFGWDHPFAAVKLAYDKDSDIIYVTNAYRIREATPLIHAAALKPWLKGWEQGTNFYFAWPHDGLQHDKGSGKQLAQIYRDEGLPLYYEHAKFPDERGTGVEAGIMLMLERMLQGRLKVFGNLTEWFDEFRLYHRVDGKIVKERDDLMSATRYAMMMLRIAKGQNKAPVNDRYRRRSSSGEGSWLTQ
jgi:phage terminase large subunit-like protein